MRVWFWVTLVNITISLQQTKGLQTHFPQPAVAEISFSHYDKIKIALHDSYPYPLAPTRQLSVHPRRTIRKVDRLLLSKREIETRTKERKAPLNAHYSSNIATRRLLLATACLSGSVFLAGREKVNASELQWEASPVNKRSGVTVFDAENAGYNVKFVTYLSRFLLNFDENCQRWWYSKASEIPRNLNAEQVAQKRLKQFGAFSASVEVGLQDYTGAKGPRRLLRSLLNRYCPSFEALEVQRASMNLSEAKRQDREIDEARRQIALMFGLLEKAQPVDEITTVLAQIDNATISEVEILDGGAGYAPGYGPPAVEFPPPEAGEGYVQAKGRAQLKPNGRVLRIDVVDRGFGYTKAPEVVISSPAGSVVMDPYNVTLEARTAKAKAILFTNGVNKGRIERIELIDSGVGYRDSEKIIVKLSSPQLPQEEGGSIATAKAIREYEVAKIDVFEPGSGYAAEKAIPVKVEAPPLFARVNMNDPILVALTNEASKRKLPNRIPTTLGSTKASALKAAEDSSSDCTGRECYDTKVVAYAYARPQAETVFARQRDDDDIARMQDREAAADGISPKKLQNAIRGLLVDGSVGGRVSTSYFGGGSSASLLALLPDGIGLQYDPDVGRYKLAAKDDVEFDFGSNEYSKPLDPEFGPRGRSPIEKQKNLDLGSFGAFALSGALSCAATHFTLTPLDVVKTKIQTDPNNYPNAIIAFQKVLAGGIESMFSGWVPTTLGFFTIGGFSYSTTELFRRWCEDFAGTSASQFEVPILLFAAAVSAFFGAFIIAPFETVRIRSVYQPDYAENALGVVKRMNEEEGIGSFFSAVPAFALKDVPFCMAKFTVFDQSSSFLYNQYPVAREDLRLSLYVSLVAGTLGGIAASIVSNPADASISEMKKSKSDINPPQAAMALIDRGGPSLLFSGLPVRMIYYSILVSLQFLLYDAVRFALGIGSDDLKLYLDVLGGALSQTGGPV